MDASRENDFDVIVIGAGFAGLYALYRLRGLGLRVHVYERGDDVGGTWYWNRYPGARCDVESMYYSYSFSAELEQEWEWTELFPAQPEILRYAGHVADRFDLRRDITFGASVSAATFGADANRWTVETAGGSQVTASFLVTAVGCLSESRVPQFPGLDSFRGSTYHTGRWPHEGADLAGQRVGVIGTGSSGIQAIPVIAAQAEHVTVFQRTAELARRWERGGTSFMTTFSDTSTSEAANEVAAGFVRDRIREIVRDPQTAELLVPRDYPIGTKRICLDTDYFATYNRDNVSLVSVREQPIERVTPAGIVVGGQQYELDAIVFATGYDAMTGPLNAIDIRGADGQLLRDNWAAGPRAYLGVSSAGFPNLFMLTGPGSPSVLVNMIVAIEQHVDWVAGLISHAQASGVVKVEATQADEDAWVERVNELASRTLYPKAASWYMGANVPGKPRVFMPYIGGMGTYRVTCDEVAANGYPGFILTHEQRPAGRAASA